MAELGLEPRNLGYRAPCLSYFAVFPSAFCLLYYFYVGGQGEGGCGHVDAAHFAGISLSVPALCDWCVPKSMAPKGVLPF